MSTVDAKARLLKRGWPKGAFDSEDLAKRGAGPTTLVRAKRAPPPPRPTRDAESVEDRARLRRALAAAPRPARRSAALRVSLLAREDAKASRLAASTALKHAAPTGASGVAVVCAKVLCRGPLSDAARDVAATAVSRGVRGFGGRVVDVAAGDDWLTVCAAFVAKPPLNESAGRATAAALAVAPRVAWKGFSRLGPSVRPSVDVEGRLGSTRVSVGRASLRRSTRDRRVQP